MQLPENIIHTTQCLCLGAGQSLDRAQAAPSSSSKRLLVLLGSGLAIAGGPPVLDTAIQASLSAVQILLEICRVSLVAYQILGR
jgi:hypothetical protein